MKINALLSLVAALAATTFTFGLALGAFTVAATTLTLSIGALFLLIVMNDYAPRTTYTGVRGQLIRNRERLRLAA